MSRAVTYIFYDGEWKCEQESNGQQRWRWDGRNKRVVPINVEKSTIKLHSLVELLYEKLGVDHEFELKLSYLPDPIGYPPTAYPPVVVENDYILESYLIDDVKPNRLKDLYVELVRKEENVRLNEFDSNDNGLCNEEEQRHHRGEHDLGNEERQQGGENQDDYFDRQFVVDVASNPDGEREILGTMSPNMWTTASAPTPPNRTNPSRTASVDIDNTESPHLDMLDIGTSGTALVEYASASSYSFLDGSDLAIGQEFASKIELQKILNEIALKGSFEMTVVKSTKTLYVVKCVDPQCGWRLRAAQITNSTSFSIRTYCNTHTCSLTSRKRKHRQATAAIVADVVSSEFKGQNEAPQPKLIQSIMQNRGVSISYWKAWRSKQLAHNHLRGSPETSFELLPSYLYMVEKRNDGSITHLEVDADNRFKYAFLAFGVCIQGFKCMRKVISIDGTFLKSKYRGTLLIATAQDGNFHQYPLAFGVVDSENDASWKWFLTMLQGAFPDEEELVIISDRHQSIIKAVGEVYPKASHGHCLWHIKQNLKARFKHEGLLDLFTATAEAYTNFEFEKNFDMMKSRYPGVVDYLQKHLDVGRWARSHFVGARYNIMTTNGSESINGVLNKAREYPLIALLDALQELVSRWWNNHRKEAMACGDTSLELTPKTEEILRVRFRAAEKMVPVELNAFEFHVRGDKESVIVNLLEKSCECRVFNVDRLPCAHAIAAIGVNNVKEVYNHCSDYYKLNTWILAYAGTVYPVPSSNTWDVPEEIQSTKVLPPSVKVKLDE